MKLNWFTTKYCIITTTFQQLTYFILLYEKIKCLLKKDCEIIKKLNELKIDTISIECVDDRFKNKRIDKINNEGEQDKFYKITIENLSSKQQSCLRRFRNLLAHAKNEFNYKVFKKNNQICWDEQTKSFYLKYEKEFNSLLNEMIAIARKILLNCTH